MISFQLSFVSSGICDLFLCNHKRQHRSIPVVYLYKNHLSIQFLDSTPSLIALPNCLYMIKFTHTTTGYEKFLMKFNVQTHVWNAFLEARNVFFLDDAMWNQDSLVEATPQQLANEYLWLTWRPLELVSKSMSSTVIVKTSNHMRYTSTILI